VDEARREPAMIFFAKRTEVLVKAMVRQQQQQPQQQRSIRTANDVRTYTRSLLNKQQVYRVHSAANPAAKITRRLARPTAW
jgi:dsDNA-binding SOS-regulon protein